MQAKGSVNHSMETQKHMKIQVNTTLSNNIKSSTTEPKHTEVDEIPINYSKIF